MEYIDCLNFNDFLNHSFCVKKSLQDKIKVVHLDVIHCGKLQSNDQNISQVFLIENQNSVFFLHLRIDCENILK